MFTLDTVKAAAVASLLAFAASPALADEVVLSGQLKGDSGHVTTGTVQVVELDNGRYRLDLSGDFSLDNAPDPEVAFGRNGRYVAAGNVGALKKLRGGQSYALPAAFNPSVFDTFFIWCGDFAVSLGKTALRAS
ncbi:MAG: DM13 domain-containing protein [Pseudomonadota bacterium]